MTENKKKLLHIVEAMGGGIFTYLVDLTNELVEQYEIYIAFAIHPQTPDNYRLYFDKRIHLIEVTHFTRAINPYKDLKALQEIKKIAKNIKPDIIHLHSSKAGVLGRIAFNAKKIPVFYTPHGYSFLMKDCSRVKRQIYRAIEAVCAKRNCTTISCSLGEHKETLKLTKKAVYVNNGINIKKLQNMLDGIEVKKHPFTVFTLGRICYQKNPSLFNEIAKAMPNIKFVWIGDGELRDELKEKNIEITGWVQRTDALTYAMNADLFLLTSLWEGLPVSLLEAMYMRKPCVVSDVIGNHDVIQNEKNGYVCQELSEYKRAIETIEYKETDELVDEAYKDILINFNTQIMAKRYHEKYSGDRKT